MVGVWTLTSAVASAVTLLAFHMLSSRMEQADSARTAIIIAEVYACLLIAMRVVFRDRIREILALRRTTVLVIAVSAIAVAISYALTGIVQRTLAPHSWHTALAILAAIGSDDGRLASSGSVIGAVIVARACVLAPIGEELFFRGALFAWLRSWTSARTTIVVTAAAFALIHTYPPVLPLGFAIGLALGWIRERCGSTVPTIVAHVANDVLLVVLSYWLNGWHARLPPWGA
jgi:membrane protease YdiL (CAAX protease family)